MNGDSNFGKRNYEANKYEAPYHVNIPYTGNRIAAFALPLASQSQFYQFNDQYDHNRQCDDASTSNSCNLSLPYQFNSNGDLNKPVFFQDDACRIMPQSFNGNDAANIQGSTNYEFGPNNDSSNYIYNGIDSGISQNNFYNTPSVQEALPPASDECFISQIYSEPNQMVPSINILKKEVAARAIELVSNSSILNSRNGTRPKELNEEKKINNKKQLCKDQYRKEHEKDGYLNCKKGGNHYQSSRQNDIEHFFSNDPSNTKIYCNEYNNYTKDFGRAKGRGRISNSYSYVKKPETKNNSSNHYARFQNSDHEKYANHGYKSANISEGGRFNSRHKSFNNQYYGQSSKYNSYVNNYDRGYNNARHESPTSFKMKNEFQNNENYNKCDKSKITKETKLNFNRKYDKPKIFSSQWNSVNHNLESNQELKEEGKEWTSNLHLNNKGVISTKAKLIENSKAIVISQNTAMLDRRTQRETMIDLLSRGIFECMVCCERIKQPHAIWSCCKCYNCFHLGCIKKWAGTSQGDPGWRCPACQNLNAKVPSGYYCFCKKMREPEWNRRETPHSCGEVCALKRENEWCTHKCTSLCHPGPCPECSAFVKRSCRCGKNTKEMRCSVTEPYLCGEQCMKPLNCGIHFCKQICHIDSCETCSESIVKNCYCGRESQTMPCAGQAENELLFSCNTVCEKMLSCNHHSCQRSCHPGLCDPCDRAVDIVKFCPCGKMELKSYYHENEISPRSSCTDAIPTCNNICDNLLKCGTPGSYHSCQSLCHEDQCPPCQSQTVIKCRCGFMDKSISCTELQTKADEVMCEKQCKKWRQCGRHKCGVKCCIDIDHICERICSRTLKCRLHKCQEACHRGNCPRCWETSFEELSCHCGASVIYPPVPCGTLPPACDLSCRREQSCSHSVAHNCHADVKCPPCTTLVSKPCFGNHTIMKSTPCYVTAMSCGDLCEKMLPCKIHKCLKVCHEGPCIKGEKCNQNCTERRNSCEHACNNKCHAGPCPNTPCKETVSVTCICGNRKVDMICSDNEKEYKSVATSKLASMMHNMNNGGSVDLSHIFSGSNKAEKFQRLECNDECGLIARNRRLALALQISNPDSRAALGENSIYPESMKDEARKDMQFAKSVHNSLNDLVLKAKESKQKNRSHSFAPMNRDKRSFIHEYSKFFGCQSQSYDEEPKKNVVVTACKLMSRLPPVSIISVIQKEQGQRKIPGPVLPRKNIMSDDNSNAMKKLEKSGSFEKKDVAGKGDCSDRLVAASNGNEKPATIDYFDFS